MNITEPDGYLSTIPEPDGRSELTRWREVRSTLDALIDNPEAFSRGESVKAHFDKYVTLAGIYEAHHFPVGAELIINPASGAIYEVPMIEADVALEEAE